MIVRSFYVERTHLAERAGQAVASSYGGCYFETPAASALRVKCDQFLTNDEGSIVIMRGEETPTCSECREKLRIEAVAAAASAE